MAVEPARAWPAAPAPLAWHRAAPQGERFIRCYSRVLPGPMPALPYILARFALARYTSEQFALHAIEFPLNIRNSVAKRQAEFIAGRICAQAALTEYGGDGHCVAIGSHRQPLWPAGLIGSITHNGQYAAALVCPSHALLGVGIDIESVVSDEARQAMTELVVSPEEAHFLRGAAGTLGFDCLLTLVFSAKESFFKAAFAQVKEYFDFDAVRVIAIDPARAAISLRCVRTLCPRLPEGRVVEARFELLDSATILTAVLLGREGEL
ncbi:MAG TPA: 4'-phosphopantetheinyl transferase superfamily protein [Burkholderiaceae bacterium]|jgi:4'-phosphopantetheinyl transferase EntD|nr:4'-phosphopantetheinyl transferase superfamily protein [Burkholderiaceae bacterium]